MDLEELDVFRPETLEAWYSLYRTHEAQDFYALMASLPQQHKESSDLPSRQCMGTCNTLKTRMVCPRCDVSVEVEIEMEFGDTCAMAAFAVGDRYAWVPGKAVPHGGRPENGDLYGEGYAECPHCRRDFFVKVLIRGDRIEDVVPDAEKAGYSRSSEVALDALPSPPRSAWKPFVAPSEPGRITWNPKWALTPRLKALLEQLSAFGVDVYSTVGGSDYTLLVPNGLSRNRPQRSTGSWRRWGKRCVAK